jgi:hypothetical protein
MTTRSLARVTRQIALPIHPCPTSLAVHLAANVTMRTAVVAVLARLLLEAAASQRTEEVRDES